MPTNKTSGSNVGGPVKNRTEQFENYLKHRGTFRGWLASIFKPRHTKMMDDWWITKEQRFYDEGATERDIDIYTDLGLDPRWMWTQTGGSPGNKSDARMPESPEAGGVLEKGLGMVGSIMGLKQASGSIRSMQLKNLFDATTVHARIQEAFDRAEGEAERKRAVNLQNAYDEWLMDYNPDDKTDVQLIGDGTGTKIDPTKGIRGKTDLANLAKSKADAARSIHEEAISSITAGAYRRVGHDRAEKMAAIGMALNLIGGFSNLASGIKGFAK